MQSVCFALPPVSEIDVGERAFFATALDGVETGVALLDADGTIVHANRSMGDFARCGLVATHARRLTFVDVACGVAFEAATRAAAAGDASTAPTTTLVARDARGERRLIVTVLPTCEEDASGTRRRGVVVLANDPTRGASADRRHFEIALGLTPAESVVAAALMEGLDAARVATRLNISRETVRTHIKRIFDKTQTRRQPELVMLLARVSAVSVMARTFTRAGDDAQRIPALV